MGVWGGGRVEIMDGGGGRWGVESCSDCHRHRGVRRTNGSEKSQKPKVAYIPTVCGLFLLMPPSPSPPPHTPHPHF